MLGAKRSEELEAAQPDIVGAKLSAGMVANLTE